MIFSGEESYLLSTKQSHSSLLDLIAFASVFDSSKHVLSLNKVNHLHPGINKMLNCVSCQHLQIISLHMNMGVPVPQLLQCTIPSGVASINGYEEFRISPYLIIIKESCLSTNLSK